MNHQKILADIKARKFSPIYFLCGEEPYYIDVICKTLEKQVLKEEEREFNQNIYYGLDVDVSDIIAEARKYPMMAEYNVVIVREAQLLKNINDLEAYFSKPIDSTILVLCYKNKKLDKRKSIYKTLQKNGIYYENKKLYDNQIPDWINAHLGQAGYNISVKNALMITDFIGNDLSNITNELGKIILNLPQGTTITEDAIEEYIGINKDYNNFELNNALGHRNILKTNRIINYFSRNNKKYPMPLILGNLFSFFSKILKFHYVQGKPRAEQAVFVGVHPFFLKDYEFAAKQYSLQKLVEIIEILHQYDLKSKGVGSASVSDGELMKEMVYQILH